MTDTEEEDNLDQRLIYWDCNNEHLWASRHGPLPETWFLELLHQETTGTRIKRDEKKSFLVAGGDASVCPDCGIKMKVVEVMVNVKFNTVQTSQA